MSTTSTSYDTIQYPSYPYPATHPAHLATVARFFGLESPDIQKCRVLELGCAGGGNLMPMAEVYPESEFFGVDLSKAQIEDGQKIIQELGFKNLEIKQGNIQELGDVGTFDYILCHGVYSWIPEEVQEAVLDVYQKHLAPNGIGYISYNTYPGWHMRGMLREIMCFHASRFDQPSEQVRQARMLLDFLSNALTSENDPYPILLRKETDMLRNLSDSYLYHEHLEEHNQPCYFFEFAQRLVSKNLQYLGDASIPTMIPHNFKDEVRETLQRVAGSIIEMEQYMDFLRNRTFRSSLICHRDVELKRNIEPSIMRKFYAFSSVREIPKKEGEDESSKVVNYIALNGVSMASDSPFIHAAFEILGDVWPQGIAFDDFIAKLKEKGIDSETTAPTLESVLLRLFTGNMLDISVEQVRSVNQLPEKPKTSPLVRFQATKYPYVATLKHQIFRTDDLSRRMLTQMDGTNDQNTILESIIQEFKKGNVNINHDGQPVKDEELARKLISEAVPERFEAMRLNALLIE